MRQSNRRNAARKILRRWAKIDEEIKAAESAYKALCDEVDAVAAIRAALPSTTQALTGMPHGGGSSDPTQVSAVRRVELGELYRPRMELYNNKVKDSMRFKLKVQDAFVLVPTEAETVVIKHWRERKYMFDVAAEMNISESTAWRYERIVLAAIADEFNL